MSILLLGTDSFSGPNLVKHFRRHNGGYEGDRALGALAATPRRGLLPRLGVGVQPAALGQRTVVQALADGVPCKIIWRAVWAALELPARDR